MADIELVIKIPEELLSKIDDENYQSVIYWYNTTLYCAIKDGTPLPEGHGRLIDEKDLSLATVHLIDGIFVCDAPTIIEADEEDKE